MRGRRVQRRCGAGAMALSSQAQRGARSGLKKLRRGRLRPHGVRPTGRWRRRRPGPFAASRPRLRRRRLRLLRQEAQASLRLHARELRRRRKARRVLPRSVQTRIGHGQPVVSLAPSPNALIASLVATFGWRSGRHTLIFSFEARLLRPGVPDGRLDSFGFEQRSSFAALLAFRFTAILTAARKRGATSGATRHFVDDAVLPS